MKNFFKSTAKFVALALVVTVLAHAANPILSNLLTIGDGTMSNKVIKFNRVGPGSSGNPQFRWNEVGQVLEFSNDGVIFSGIPNATNQVPTGAELDWPVSGSAPTGYIFEDGTAYSRTGATAALFAVIGTTYGIGDGLTTFNVPDSRGVVFRGPDGGSGLDSDIADRTNYSAGVFGATFTFTGSTHNSVTIDTIDPTDFANLAVGMYLTATDVGAYITALIPPSSITISTSASGSNAAETITATTSATGPYAGSYQSDDFASHTHDYYAAGGASNGPYSVSNSNPARVNAVFYTGGNETVSKNVYHYKIIKQ